MKTDYYVAGRVRNSENILRLNKGIKDKGYSCYSFLKEPGVMEESHLPFEEQIDLMESHPDFWTDPVHRHHFEEDMAGLKNANTVVVLLPAGLASHMEAGASYGLGKKLILIGAVEKPETLYLMFDERYPDIESFFETI